MPELSTLSTRATEVTTAAGMKDIFEASKATRSCYGTLKLERLSRSTCLPEQSTFLCQRKVPVAYWQLAKMHRLGRAARLYLILKSGNEASEEGGIAPFGDSLTYACLAIC